MSLYIAGMVGGVGVVRLFWESGWWMRVRFVWFRLVL